MECHVEAKTELAVETPRRFIGRKQEQACAREKTKGKQKESGSGGEVEGKV